MISIDYPISATANDAVDPTSLYSQIQGAALSSATFEYVSTDSDPTGSGVPTIYVWFDSEPNSADRATLGGIIAAHTGVAAPRVTFHASSKFVESTAAISNDTDWEVLGGVVTSPSFFADDLDSIVGRCTGFCEVTGLGVELRVTENGATMLSSPHALSESGTFQFDTDTPPSAGQNVYRLEARLNGATAASVSFVSMSLLEVR